MFSNDIQAEIEVNIQHWLTSSVVSVAHKQEIQSLIDGKQVKELQEAFYQPLEFGTGGLRGIMGIGINRMNIYTVGQATQGLANYLNKTYPNQEIKVAVAYDSRNQSPEFAQIIANVFSANDIYVYLFSELRPTPALSFAVRHLECKSGVVVTASHNPKEYNGYKAYWNDGSQLVSPHDKNVMEEVKKVQLEDIRFTAKKEKITFLQQEIDEVYLKVTANAINMQSIDSEILERSKLKIVYTPIHGTGVTLVPKLLQKLGFENVEIVAEQQKPDGNFPTVVYPNPEEAEALTLALKKASEANADLVLATDPDADRVGIAVKDDKNNFVLLNGNQTGTLLMYYLLSVWKEKNKLKNNEYIVKTIVTSDLVDKMCENFGVECFNTLTGFKYIAAIIRENEGKKTYIAGFEESYGYLVGDDVRDKDGISSCGFIAQMAIYAHLHYGSVYKMLLNLYQEYGYFHETMTSLTKKGMEGIQEISKMMVTLRQNTPQMLGGSKVLKIKDFENLLEIDVQTHTKTPIVSEKSNVLQFFTEDGSKISVRPSGTEPKIKFYFGLKANFTEATDFNKLKSDLDQKAQKIMTELSEN